MIRSPEARRWHVLNEPNPLPQDRLEGSLRAVEFLSISELNYGAIVAQPLEQPGGIFNGHATGWKLPNLCTHVEDDADSSLGAEVGGCEVLGGAKTRARLIKFPGPAFAASKPEQ